MKSYGIPEIQEALAASPAIAAHEITVQQASDDELTLLMPLTKIAERGGEPAMFHGGSISLLIDTAGDFAVALAVGGGVPTINLRVDYLRPAPGPELKAIARTRRVGRSIAVADVDVLDTEGRRCAVGRGTYSTSVG